MAKSNRDVLKADGEEITPHPTRIVSAIESAEV